MEETLYTAARRVLRNIRSDDSAHGGLISIDTLRSAETLAKQLDIHHAKTQPTPVIPVHKAPPDR